MFDTTDIIKELFGNIKIKKFDKVSHSAKETRKRCPFKFFLRYFAEIEVEKPSIMIKGINQHNYISSYYKIVDFKNLYDAFTSFDYNTRKLSNYIYKPFRKIVRDDDIERNGIYGFANLESSRFKEIMDFVDYNRKKAKILYLPILNEKKLRCDFTTGVIDTVFRTIDREYKINDWKCGMWKPRDDKPQKKHKDQAHTYAILLDENNFYDKAYKKYVKPKSFSFTFVLHEFVINGEIEKKYKENLKETYEETIEEINSGIFPMRGDAKYCKFNTEHPCVYFEVVCKNILESFDIVFDNVTIKNDANDDLIDELEMFWE